MLIVCIVLFLIIVIAAIVDYLAEIDTAIVGVIAICILLTAIIIWPVMYQDSKSNYRSYVAAKQTIEAARSGEISEVERAALVTKMLEINAIIADANYWNGTILKDAVYNKLANAEYLK